MLIISQAPFCKQSGHIFNKPHRKQNKTTEKLNKIKIVKYYETTMVYSVNKQLSQNKENNNVWLRARNDYNV